MPTDYSAIREENIRRYGTETAHLALLGDLYSERTHFIFELLQNAEDAKATQVHFRLGAESLELCHNGRLFTQEDVRGISSICQSTNQGDPERIGRFGIGFKSVYAYTRRPEIHSGDEHFAIEHYVRPEGAVPRHASDGSTTLIVLPLNADSPASSDARREIQAAFGKLDPINLLFLRHIQRVELFADGPEPTSLVRTPLAQLSPLVRMVGISSSDARVPEQRWLVFERSVNLTTPASRQLDLRVEVAFFLSADSSESQLTVIPRDRSTLAVFFPTSRPTSTSFILQGPFIPTPDRSNVREKEPLNIRLANEAAELVVEALRWLRDKGALSKAALATLPLRRSEFSADSLFRPLFDRVLQALTEERLLPACAGPSQDGPFVTGQNAKAASSADLRELLTPKILTEFLGDAKWRWLAEDLTVRGDSDLACYLRTEIAIREVTARDLVSWLETKEILWWESLDESWLIRLYRYLHAQTVEHRHLKALPIIRLENGLHASAAKQAIFFPAANPHEAGELAPFLPTLPVTRQSLLQADSEQVVESFLRQMGVAPLVASEFIRRHVIPRYEAKPSPTVAENRTHIRFLKRAVGRMSADELTNLVTALSNVEVLICKTVSDTTHSCFVKPTNAYIPAAYTGDDALELFFHSSPRTWFVDAAYLDPTEKPDEWRKLLLRLGVADSPRVTESEDWCHGKDRHVDGLDAALASISKCPQEMRIGTANAIWSVVTRLLPDDEIYAQHTWNQFLHGQQKIYGPRGGYHGSRVTDASFFVALRDRAWLPDTTGKSRQPSDLFEDTNFNHELLGETVFYLHKQITLKNQKEEWLAAKLGIRRSPTKESALLRLKALKAATTTVIHTQPLYEFLDRTRADVCTAFEQEGLVFCPSSDPQWLKPSQAFWEDESVVFGATRGYLKKDYPKLRDFFMRAGVAPSARPTDHAKALLEISQAALVDEATRIRIQRNCKRLAQSLEEGGDWQNEGTWKDIWTRLRQGAHWLGATGDGFGFHRLDEIVRVDNEHLADLFSSKLPFWPFRDLNDFASQHLEVIGVSSATCRFEPINPGGVAEGLSDGLKTNWPLIVAFLYSEKWKADLRENTATALENSPAIYEATRIAVTYALMGVQAEEPGGKSGFFDVQAGIQWLVKDLKADEATEAIGDALQEFFGPEVLREFVCDLFRKGPDRTVEKWRKKGLILNQHPEDDAEEPTEQESSGDTQEEPNLGKNVVSGHESTDAPTEQGLAPSRRPASSGGQDSASGKPSDTADRGTTSAGPPETQSAPPGADLPPGRSIADGQTETTGSGETGSSLGGHPQAGTETAATPEEDGGTEQAPAGGAGTETTAKDIPQALHDAFNKPGNTNISDDRPESGSVRNPEDRRRRTRENYARRKSREPAASQRVTRRVIDVWDSKNKAIRDFLYEEYAGRCQICGETNRFPRRDGKAYFEAVYLIPHTEAAWTDEPGSVICLCALCSAKFQHGTVRCENVAAQLGAQKTIAEGGQGKPVVNIELVGKQVGIRFTERHLIEVQEMLSLTEAAPQPWKPGLQPSGMGGTSTVPAVSNPPGVSKSELVRCDLCHQNAPLVRKDRLQQHVARTHGGTRARAASRVTLPRPAKENAGVRRCLACGKPVVPGEDYCYTHM